MAPWSDTVVHMYYGQLANRPPKPQWATDPVYTRLMNETTQMPSSTPLSDIILDLNCLEAGGERHDDYCEAYDYVVECVQNCASMEEMYNLLEQFDAYSDDYDGDREGYTQAIQDCEYVINSARDDWEEVG